MNEQPDSKEYGERREEPRESLERYYSIEMMIGGPYTAYQFKLRNISKTGLCILVREDSAVLQKLDVGQVYEVKFFEDGASQPSRIASAEVRHITRQPEGRYQGHCLVGLEVKPDPDAAA